MMAPSACNTAPGTLPWSKAPKCGAGSRRRTPYARMVENASLAVVVGARPDLLPGDMAEFWPQDCAAATENLLLEAVALGYGAVWCGVYPQKERMAEIRSIVGGDSVPFNVIAVGVPGGTPPRPQLLRPRPRPKPINTGEAMRTFFVPGRRL